MPVWLACLQKIQKLCLQIKPTSPQRTLPLSPFSCKRDEMTSTENYFHFRLHFSTKLTRRFLLGGPSTTLDFTKISAQNFFCSLASMESGRQINSKYFFCLSSWKLKQKTINKGGSSFFNDDDYYFGF